MENLYKWEESIKNLEEKINRFLFLSQWKFKQNIEGGEKIDIDDATWEEKIQPISWSLNDGDTYLRKWIEIPEEIEGIKIEGSKISLKFVFPSGVILYINGNEVYSHKFWADKVATPFLLTEYAKSGEKILITFKTLKGDGLGTFWACFVIDTISDLIFELKSLLYQIKFAQLIVEEEKKKGLKLIFEECIKKIDHRIIEEKKWEEVKKKIEEMENLLQEFKIYAKKYKVHLIGHAHIDMNWLWTYDDTINVCLRDFSTVTNLMEKYYDLTFSQSQAHVYKIVEENDKKLFEKIKEKVKEGKWDITANAWVENDLNMSDGESIVRHILYSKKYIEGNFKKKVEIMWSPDTFGHPHTIPTILKNADIKYYYFMRCGKGYPLFLWEGKDKSRVIAFNSVYNNEINPDRIIPSFIDYHKKYKIKDFMFVYGVGDHGGGPTEQDIKRKYKLEKKPCFPSLEFSTTHKFFKSIEKYKKKFSVVKDELNFIFEGCYTTHSDIKKANRRCENELLKLETISAIGKLYDIQYQEKKIEEMWQKTLFNQFHDILCGSAIHKSYEYSNMLAEDVLKNTDLIIKDTLSKITEKKENTITVFNPCGWEANYFVRYPYKEKKEIHLEDETGNKIEAEIKEDVLSFYVSLPGYNFKSLYIKEGKFSGKKIKFEDEELENEFYRIWIDKKTGLIRKIYDKENKRDVIPVVSSIPEDRSSYWVESCGNLIKIYWEKPHPMSAWIIGNIYKVENLIDADKIEIKENLLTTVFEIERTYNENTPITQKIIIYRDFPFIDFEFTTNWQITGNKEIGVPMIRVNFAFNFEKPEFYCEIPFGVMKRKNIPREYPGLKWAGFNEDKYWCAIINREKYGYYVNGNNLSLTLLRNPYEPDGNPDSGFHHFSYRLFFGKSTISEITKLSVEYNTDPVVVEGEIKKQKLFKLKGNLVPTTFKKSIKDECFILRLIEVEGKRGKEKIIFEKDVKNIWRCNLNEENLNELKVKNNQLEINFKPYEIVTLKIEFK